MSHKRNAFTLVEVLLVVIAVVILSTMVMLASGESQAASKATKIVNDLANLKIFALTWYRENIDNIDTAGNFNGSDIESYFRSSDGQDLIKKFFVNDVKVNYAGGTYGIVSEKNNDGNLAYYVCFYLEKNSDGEKIKSKLADKAATTSSLLQKDGEKWIAYIDGQEIYMQILAFNY